MIPQPGLAHRGREGEAGRNLSFSLAFGCIFLHKMTETFLFGDFFFPFALSFGSWKEV